MQRTSQCSQCGAETTRDDVTLLTALSYPDNSVNRTYSTLLFSFSFYLLVLNWIAVSCCSSKEI